jgi:hypothetical protein
LFIGLLRVQGVISMANKTLQLKIGNTTYRSSVDNTLTNEDLNNVILPGLYNAGGSNSVTNKPSGIDHFGLLVIHRASGAYYIQIIYNDSKSYRRFCVNGTWGNWTEDKLTDTTYTSLKNPHALTLKINSASGIAYDGSSPITYDVTKTSLGLNKVDNTADSAKNVNAATKLQTYKAGSTTETYGDSYPAYMQWQSDDTLKLICTGYKTRVDIADSALPLSGGTLTGQVNFGSGSYYVRADGTANFRTVTGAVYNDYAEFFPRGEATEPGDIVALDLTSDHESYIKATATSKIVAGVHSDEYAMLIGGDKVDDGNYVEKNIEKYIPVSLCGRVFCKCVGKIHRGDTIVVSEIPGIGRAKLPNDYVENTQIVGYAVDEDMNEEIRRVRIRVKG